MTSAHSAGSNAQLMTARLFAEHQKAATSSSGVIDLSHFARQRKAPDPHMKSTATSAPFIWRSGELAGEEHISGYGKRTSSSIANTED